MNFSAWFIQLKIASTRIYGFSMTYANQMNPADWHQFWADGMSPEEALLEDATNA